MKKRAHFAIVLITGFARVFCDFLLLSHPTPTKVIALGHPLLAAHLTHSNGSWTPETTVATKDPGEDGRAKEATRTQRKGPEESRPGRVDHLLSRVQVPNARPQDLQTAFRE